MDESDKFCMSLTWLLAITLLSLAVAGIFKEEMIAFFEYHFTKEFLNYVFVLSVVTAWISCIILGVLFLLYIKFKE